MLKNNTLTLILMVSIIVFGCGDEDQEDGMVSNASNQGGEAVAGGAGGTAGMGGESSEAGAAGENTDGGATGVAGEAEGNEDSENTSDEEGGTSGEGGASGESGASGEGGETVVEPAPNCPSRGDRCEAVCEWVVECAINSGECIGYSNEGEAARVRIYQSCLRTCAGSSALATLTCSHRRCEQTIRVHSNVSEDFEAGCNGVMGSGGDAGDAPTPDLLAFTAAEADALIENSCSRCHQNGIAFPDYDGMSYNTVYNKVRRDYIGSNRMPKNGPYWSDDDVERLRLLMEQ